MSALACAASAQQPAPPAAAPRQPLATIVAEPVAMMIAACDQNGDAIVSRAELAACVAHSFASADSAHKGSIGYIEYGDWALKWLGDANALPSPFEVDGDGDNRVTLAELQARFDAIFTRLDRDRDGNLTRAELLTIRSGVGAGDRPPGKRSKRRGGADAS
ncbi:EF-hand domain-containing protein [Sphingomonas sp. NFR15]|uniref:EF-hand domain-containing protein n=1 Tax=Sphingomonas sp. NFR15 TaxID=1566282 RepID=UPI00210E5C62|nr:EF-hand domain-containing protein [Sphingomonas sp. NFR15]